MDSEELVELALRALKCSQKELARRLGVSPTQVSKWKNGEHISFEMNEKLRTLGECRRHGSVVCLVSRLSSGCEQMGDVDRVPARSGERLNEAGYDMSHFGDELPLVCSSVFDALNELLTKTNPYSALIHSIRLSSNNVWGFYAAYVSDLIDDEDLELHGTQAENIEPQLIHLAAAKTEVDEAFAPHAVVFGKTIYANALMQRCRVISVSISARVALRWYWAYAVPA